MDKQMERIKEVSKDELQCLMCNCTVKEENNQRSMRNGGTQANYPGSCGSKLSIIIPWYLWCIYCACVVVINDLIIMLLKLNENLRGRRLKC